MKNTRTPLCRALVCAFALSPLFACSADVVKEKPVAAVKPVAVASAPKAGNTPDATIRAALQAKYPDVTIGEIRPTPLAGMFEVVVNREVVYTDSKAQYLLVGNLIDLASQKNLTEARKQEVNKVDFNALPKNLAFTLVRGNGQRKVAVFTDPDCPYCRKVETESLQQLDNVTIYYYMLPLDFHPDAARKSRAIACSENPGQAWRTFMLEGKEPAGEPKADCKPDFAAIKQLGASLGITGTPGLVFENGQVVPGAVPKAQIEDNLNKSMAVKTTAK